MTRLSIGGKSRNGMNLSQARWQVATVSGYLTPVLEAEKLVRACQAVSPPTGGVDTLEGGRDLPAVLVGDEPHRVAEPGGTRAGGDRRLGPGLPPFAPGAGP